MEKIFVTTDFSGNSKAGIRFAIQLASQMGSQLAFYHLIEVMKPTSWNDAVYKKFAADLISKNTKKLKQFVSETYKENGKIVKNAEYIAEIGTGIDEMIISRAKKAKASYICMSTHGAGKIKKLFGTNASELITTSPIPVIVVPYKFRVKSVTKIFYASDFSAIKKELDIVKKFAASLKASVEVFNYDYLLHVKEVRDKLEKKVYSLNVPEITFHFKRQEIEKSISKQMSGDIEKRKPSLVILFTKQNRNWFDRLFAKKETKEMSFDSKVPILTFRKK